MAKNKKPRKKYVPKNVGSYMMTLPQRDIDRLRNIFANVSLCVEYKLPRGKMTLDDVCMLRDYVNLGTALSVTGHHFDVAAFESETREKWLRFQRGFHSYYQRAIHEKCFTCTAEELDAIREGCVIADQMFTLEMEKEPAWVFSNLLYIKDITCKPNTKTVECDLTTLEEQIRKICVGAHRHRLQIVQDRVAQGQGKCTVIYDNLRKTALKCIRFNSQPFVFDDETTNDMVSWAKNASSPLAVLKIMHEEQR